MRWGSFKPHLQNKAAWASCSAEDSPCMFIGIIYNFISTVLQHMLFATLHSPWCQQLYIYIYIFSFIHTTAYRSVMLESFYGSWECFHVEVERQHPYEVACDYGAGSHRSDSPQITFCVSIGIALCWFPAALLNSYLFIRTRYHLFLSHPCPQNSFRC